MPDIHIIPQPVSVTPTEGQFSLHAVTRHRRAGRG